MKNIVRSLLLSFLVIFLFVSLDSNKVVHAASIPIQIGFEPYDTAIDPDKPVVYMTNNGSKTIYAVNYETGIINTLSLPYPAERLEIYDQKLYVTQHKMSHDHYNFGILEGGIAEINTENFTLNGVMDVQTDPYDIAIDQNGWIYITPGSGQFEDLKVYSLIDKAEVANNKFNSLYERSMIYYSQDTSKVYTITSNLSPRDVNAFEVKDGQIINKYDSPYHGDYPLNPTAKITPDGLSMYNHSGVVFQLAALRSGDMVYKFQFDQKYNDFEFSLKDQLTFAANNAGGIDVYTYNTNKYLYTIKKNIKVDKLHYKNGLISIYSDDKGNHFLDFSPNYGPDAFSVHEQLYSTYDTQNKIVSKALVNGSKNVPVNSFFQFALNQQFTLNDNTKITLKGPDNFVKVATSVNKGILTIAPEYLQENTVYTLTINSDVLTNYSGEKLVGDHVVQFKTMTPPITSLFATTNSNHAPLEYIFTANAIGGINPQYQFSINENGNWKVLREYSSSRSFVWYPKSKGSFKLKVATRSDGSDVAYEKEYAFTQNVIDDVLPTAILTRNIIPPTRNNISIAVTAKDNVGIKSITLPNGSVVQSSEAVYAVSKNGTYLFEIEDLLGNVITESIKIFNIDRVLPEITLSASTTVPTKNNVIITAKTLDNMGVKRVQLPDGKFVNFENGSTAYFSVSKNGSYKFIVEDAAGNTRTSSITVSNIYKGKPATPTVNTIGDSHKLITGKAMPNSNVYAQVGSKRIGSVKASAKGDFKMAIAKHKLGTKISVYIKDPAGNVSNSKIVTVVDKTPPAAPKINKVTVSSKVITGKAEKGATVYVYNGSKYVKKGTIDSKGNLRITISKQKKQTTLSIYALDKAKNKSAITKVIVK